LGSVIDRGAIYRDLVRLPLRGTLNEAEEKEEQEDEEENEEEQEWDFHSDFALSSVTFSPMVDRL